MAAADPVRVFGKLQKEFCADNLRHKAMKQQYKMQTGPLRQKINEKKDAIEEYMIENGLSTALRQGNIRVVSRPPP